MRWLRDEIFTASLSENNAGLGMEAGAASDSLYSLTTYKMLEAEAESLAPGSGGLLFLPHFAGRVCPNDGNVRGAYIGLNLSHKRGHLFRAAMGGIGYEYAMYMEIIKERVPGVNPDRVLTVGGGAKSQLMRSIKSDILGIPVSTISRTDTGVLGMAIIAGYAVGLFASLTETVSRFVETVSETKPNAAAHAAYLPYKDIYRASFKQLDPVFRQLAAAVARSK